MIYPYATEGSWLYQVTGSALANYGTGSSTTTSDSGYFRVDLVSSDAGAGTCAFRTAGFTGAVGTSIPAGFSTRRSAGALEVARSAGSWAPTLEPGSAGWSGDFLFTADVTNGGGGEIEKKTAATTCSVAGRDSPALAVTSSYSNTSDTYATKIYDRRGAQTFVEGVGLVEAGYFASFTDKSVISSWAASTEQSTIKLIGYRIVDAGGTRTGGSMDLSGVAASAHPALTVTTQGANAIALTWTDDCLNETAWVVERSADGGGSFSQRASLPADTTAYQDVTSAATAYVYRVKARNAAGDSAYSPTAASQAYGLPVAPTLASARYMTVNVAPPLDPARWVTYLVVNFSGVNTSTQQLTLQYSTNGGGTWVDVASQGSSASGRWATECAAASGGPLVRLVASNPWGSAISAAVTATYCTSC